MIKLTQLLFCQLGQLSRFLAGAFQPEQGDKVGFLHLLITSDWFAQQLLVPHHIQDIIANLERQPQSFRIIANPLDLFRMSAPVFNRCI